MSIRQGRGLSWLAAAGAVLVVAVLVASSSFAAAPQRRDAVGDRTARAAGSTAKQLAVAPTGAGVDEDGMSPMGRLAHLAATGQLQEMIDRARARQGRLGARAMGGVPEVDDEGEGPAGGQAELTLAVDPTGVHVVVGFNDTRGFALNPTRVSGFAYSDDGGATFVDGGQLPSVATGKLASGTLLPQVFGDPDVKWISGGTGCTFIYTSISVIGFGVPVPGVPPTYPGTAQTMCIHRSTDCGHTWSGPFEIPPATNPHGALNGTNARDAADKELIDVDPDTGRVLMSWTNFSTAALAPPLGREISSTYSDDAATASPPTWSARSILDPAATYFDQGSMPRFAGNGSGNVYVAWGRSSSVTGTSYGGWSYSNVGLAISTDNGATWGAAFNLHGTDTFPIDYILGNDRVHQFPGVAVDNSAGAYQGNLYVVYADNANQDGADIAFQRSTNGGSSFSSPILLNARPGSDRAQWFPYATVDSTTGRVSVIYYDQGIAATGDLTQMTWIYSDDGGATWSKPMPLMSPGCVGAAASDCRPFHAGNGNDTGQPNLGDYVGATARGGDLLAAWAAAPEVVSYADGQPTSTSMTVPDFFFKRTSTPLAALSLGAVTFTDSSGNGFIDPGEQVRLTVPLTNYVTNATTGTVTYTGVSATLTTTTTGVNVLTGTRPYPNIGPGATQSNALPFVIQLLTTFVAGTKIELSLAVTTGQGTTTLLLTENSGTPVPTTIFSENFNGVSAGSLPAGWTTAHGGGSNTVPWTTNDTFCSTTSNALYHVNANDAANPTRWERAYSPNTIAVPAGSEYVTLELDVCTDSEDDPDFGILAYDGFTLRITDWTAGRTLRSVLTEATAETLTTGSSFHFPKHFPRNSSAAYFEDMSVWAGDSGGFKHVFMRIPGMAGSTAQLRHEYAQDSGGICSDVRPGHACGVMVDNIVMKSYTSDPTVVVEADLSLTKTAAPAQVVVGNNVTYTLVVTNLGTSTANNVTVTDNLPADVTFVSCSATGGGVCGGAGNNRTVTFASLASGASETITLVANVNWAVPNGTLIGNTASVAATDPSDPDPNNNASSADVEVGWPIPALSLAGLAVMAGLLALAGLLLLRRSLA